MTSYLKNSLAKKLSLYFKDITPDKFSLSFFKGSGTLENLAVREDFVRDALDLPPWIVVQKASCSSVRCHLSWTKLKTVPVRLIIDNLQLVIHITQEPTEWQTKSKATATKEAAKKSKPEKYGLIDAVFDGAQLEINLITVSVLSPEFDGTIDIAGVTLKNTTPGWKPTSDLKQGHVADSKAGTITLFKLLSFESLRLTVYPSSTKISKEAVEDPLIFSVKQPYLRLLHKRSLLDNSLTLSVQVQFLLDKLRLEVSKYQIQTAQLVVGSILEMTTAIAKHLHEQEISEQTPEAEKGQKTDAQLREPGSFHARINEIVVALRQPLKAQGTIHKSYLMTLKLHKVLLHDYGEADLEHLPQSSDLSYLQFLEDCQVWIKQMIAAYGRMDGVTRARLGKRVIALLVSNVQLLANSGTGGGGPAGGDAEMPDVESSPGPGLSKAARAQYQQATEHAQRHALVTPNFGEYHLPKDTILFSALLTQFVCLGSNIRPSGLPPPGCFVRVNPVKVRIMQDALMQLASFAESCQINTGPQLAEQHRPLAEHVAACSNMAETSQVETMIRSRTDIDADSLSVLQARLKEKRQALAARPGTPQPNARPRSPQPTEELPSGVEAWQVDMAQVLAKDVDERVVRYNVEILLPCIQLPRLHSGPSRIAKQTMRLVASRVLATNCPDMCKFSQGADDFLPFYEAPLCTQPSAFPSSTDDVHDSLPPFSEVTVARSTGRLMAVNVDHAWLECLAQQGEKVTLIKSIDLTLWSMARGASFKQRKSLAQSYSMIAFPHPVEISITNSQLQYLLEHFEQYDRNRLTLDEGDPIPSAVSVVVLKSAAVNLLRDRRQLAEANGTEEGATGCFARILVRDLHVVAHGSERTRTTKLGIKDVKLVDSAVDAGPGDGAADTLPEPQGKNQGADGDAYKVALRLHGKLPLPSQSLAFYEAMDRRERQAKKLALWQRAQAEERVREREQERQRQAALAAHRAVQPRRASVDERATEWAAHQLDMQTGGDPTKDSSAPRPQLTHRRSSSIDLGQAARARSETCGVADAESEERPAADGGAQPKRALSFGDAKALGAAGPARQPMEPRSRRDSGSTTGRRRADTGASMANSLFDSDDGDRDSLFQDNASAFELKFREESDDFVAVDFHQDTTSMAGVSRDLSIRPPSSAGSDTSRASEQELLQELEQWQDGPELEHFPWPELVKPTMEVQVTGVGLCLHSNQLNDLSLFAASGQEPAPSKPIIVHVRETVVVIRDDEVLAKTALIADEKARAQAEAEAEQLIEVEGMVLEKAPHGGWVISQSGGDSSGDSAASPVSVEEQRLRSKVESLERELQFAKDALTQVQVGRQGLLKAMDDLSQEVVMLRRAKRRADPAS